MKAPALVAVGEEAPRFASLFAAAASAGLRVGWLDLEGSAAPPLDLAEPIAAGAARAVAAGNRRVLSIKLLRGEPVLRDLVREHFVGYALVLVRAASLSPRLRPVAGGFQLDGPSSAARRLTAAEMLRELCRPAHRR